MDKKTDKFNHVMNDIEYTYLDEETEDFFGSEESEKTAPIKKKTVT